MHLIYRTNTLRNCYTAGYCKNGVSTFYDDIPCSKHVPMNQWFKLAVELTANADTAWVYLNGALVTNSHPMYFPHRASGGIIVGNGYDNIVRFKDLRVMQSN